MINRKIGIKEIYFNASSMEYYEFEQWIAKELFSMPSTVKSDHLTDTVFLNYGNEYK